MPGELITEVKKLAHETAKRGHALDVSALGKFAERVARIFAVQPDEVAILSLINMGKFLRFLVPEKLQAIGQIPLTSTSALAARTARERRPELLNHFSTVRHASVFEAVPLGEEPSAPIQKIMSVPLLVENKVVGVIQVCRKGSSTASAGPDFTPQELRDLIAIAVALAPCIPLCTVE